MIIAGSEILSKILHVASQSFLIPCIIGLLIFLVFVFMELGAFAAEFRQRKAKKPVNLLELWHDRGHRSHQQAQNIQVLVEASALPAGQKQRLVELLAKPGPTAEDRSLACRQFLDEQEFRAMKTLEKTDLVAKLGPILGLMGTLIPLGPGLAALGQGDLSALSQAVIIAFDTTVVGIATGGIAFFISRIRRRWYEKDLNSLEIMLQLIVGGEAGAVKEIKAVSATGRRS